MKQAGTLKLSWDVILDKIMRQTLHKDLSVVGPRYRETPTNIFDFYEVGTILFESRHGKAGITLIPNFSH